MNNYTITKTNGITKVQNAIKAEIREIITDALVAKFGAEHVKMARIESKGTKANPVNELAVRAAIITENGFEYEQCVTVPVTIKTYKEKVTSKYTVEPFDFDGTTERYTAWVAEQAEKERRKKEEKEKEIARSKARREAQKKANAEVEKAISEM